MIATFDIETNPISDWLNLSDLTTIHCLVIAVDDQEPKAYPLDEGIRILSNADLIVGHNVVSFDIPALCRFYPKFRPKGVFDTLLMARLFYADQRERDFQISGLPKELIGAHSLKSWGIRLGILKSDAPSFSENSAELVEYCIQDVRVTKALHKHLMSHPSFGQAGHAVALEHEFAWIIKEQERTGFPFDVRAAELLHADLRKKILDIETKLQEVFPPKITERVSEKTGKRLKPKTEPFNPGSRLQIAERLKERYGWEPVEFTPEGKPRVDEAVLGSLDYPEAVLLADYLTTLKRLGQLADGDEAWLKAVHKDGRLHGRVITNGAITGRCTHKSPNMAQVPTEKEYRSLFIPAEGMVLVGVDASGLELRCLAHYLGKYDNGEYAKSILEGDIHWANALAFGLTTDAKQDKNNPDHKAARNQAKGAIYALIYGAGNDKLGMVLGGNKKTGAKARANFEAKVPAYTRLKEDVAESMASRGYLRGLDGRPLYPRSEHAALNTLLQSAGAVVMKEACVCANLSFTFQKIPVKQVAAVHDEYQFMVSPQYAEQVGKLVVQAIKKAGEACSFRCQLDGEYRVGRNWAETH